MSFATYIIKSKSPIPPNPPSETNSLNISVWLCFGGFHHNWLTCSNCHFSFYQIWTICISSWVWKRFDSHFVFCWVPTKNRPWDKDLCTSNLFAKANLGSTVTKRGNITQKREKPMNGRLMSELSLWAPCKLSSSCLGVIS